MVFTPSTEIASCGKLAELFISNFAFNIDNPFTLMDLYATKQNEGETFAIFLQRWRGLY